MRLTAAGLDQVLPDGEVDLDRVEVDAGTVTLHGTLEQPTRTSGTSRMGRFPYRLVVGGVEHVEVVDRDQVVLLPVERVDYDEAAGVLQLTMIIPGHVRLRTPQREYELHVQETPTHVRRFGRWKPLPDPPSA
jgi:hypothetical protein